jgi:hypothetical protein
MQARVAIARFAAVESPNKGADEGGGGYMGRAQGIGQWLGARRHGYAVGDYQSQLAKVVREMQGKEAGAGPLETGAYNRLKNAKTPQEAAEAMEDYERATSGTVSRESLIRKTLSGYGGIEKTLSGQGAGTEFDNSVTAGIKASDRVTEAQGSLAQDRKRPITDQLRGILDQAGRATGLRAWVYSGGQDTHGPNRTGSHRHDIQPGTIGAADLRLFDQKTGNIIDADAPGGRERMAAFVKEAAKRGATGFGQGSEYMGSKDRVMANAGRLGAEGAHAGPPLSSGPVSNDNSRSVNQNINYNTNISTNDAATANSMYRRTHENLAGQQLAHAKTVVR